jgi:diguanylate cyclase (GGDEF)-like protein
MAGDGPVFWCSAVRAVENQGASPYTTVSMPKNSPTQRSHVDAELAALRAAPQVQSVDSLERGEALLKDYQEHLSVDETLYVLRICASGCQSAGRWLDGLQFCRRGIDLATRNHKSADKIAFLAITGNIHSFLRNMHLAIRAMREAILIAEQEHLLEDQIKLMQGLGPMYSMLYSHETALRLYERAYELAGGNSHASMRTGALNNIAGVYRSMGQLDLAEQNIEAALKLAQSAASRDWMPHILHTKAEILAARGNFDGALTEVTTAISLLRARKNVPVLLHALTDAASWLESLSDLDGAREYLQEAAELPKERSLYEMREELALARMKLERASNRPDQALQALDDYLAARDDGKKIKLESQRIATQFVEDVERTEARGRRESAAVNELTLRLIETQAEAQRVARQVSRDPLTGVLNRSAFESAAERASGGPSQPVALIMLDIDSFRVVNTEYGHQAGDKVLEAVVERIRQALRTNDLMGRYGGDEFLLLCPGVGPRMGATIAGRVLQRISATPVLHEGNSIPITVSIGVACTQTKALSTLPYLIKRADAALRRAKLAGKNRAITVRVNT